MLGLGRAVVVQIDDGVGAAVGGEDDELIDELAVSFSSVALRGVAAEPVAVLHGNTDDVGLPLLDGDDRRGADVFTLRHPFETGDIDALQPNLATGFVAEAIAVDVEHGREFVGSGLLESGHGRRRVAGELFLQGGGVDRLEDKIIEIEDAARALEERRHEFERDRVVGHEEPRGAVNPAGGVAVEIGRRGA